MGIEADAVRSQLLTNIDTIIDYLWRVPGVTNVEVEDSTTNCNSAGEKKVFVTFAGSSELVLLEIS
jgi:hypothetical protein